MIAHDADGDDEKR